MQDEYHFVMGNYHNQETELLVYLMRHSKIDTPDDSLSVYLEV